MFEQEFEGRDQSSRGCNILDFKGYATCGGKVYTKAVSVQMTRETKLDRWRRAGKNEGSPRAVQGGLRVRDILPSAVRFTKGAPFVKNVWGSS